jgi:hypothetical protein
VLDSIHLAEGNREDEREAWEEVETALSGLSTDAGNREIAQAAEKALVPIRERIAHTFSSNETRTPARRGWQPRSISFNPA